MGEAMKAIWELFVEDPSFTLGIIVCLIIAAFVLPHLPIANSWRGAILFVMLAIVLLENVVRSARMKRMKDEG